MKKIVLVLLAMLLLMSSAFADDVWVLCQPDSYVNIRPFASKKHEPSGIMECGWKSSTNGVTKKGYLFLDDVSNEEGCGWISKGYVVYSEPVMYTFQTNVYSNGRVACWRSIGGTRRCWVNNGDIVTVYAVSEEWSVTNKGFIKTKYLGVNYNNLLNQKLDDGKAHTEPDDLHWEDL